MNSGESRQNPYVGPRAFTEGEPLFGRSREVRQLFQMLVARRIALLHSPSGAGKTSLIQAGLIPQLKADGFRVLPVARVNKEPPGLLPGAPSFNRYIYSLLLSLEERPDGQFDEALAAVSLADYLAPKFGSEEDPELIVLIVDQFEELLTADPSDVAQKAAFFAELGQALRNPHLWALFVIREDYLGALEPYARAIPTRLANSFRLDLLETEAASEAICRPSEAQGVHFAEQAIATLVDDLRLIHVQQPDGSFREELGPYVEPVQLQVVCHRIWERLDPNKTEITVADLEASGDVDESLAAYYAGQLAAIAVDEEINESERTVRQWVERKLITRDGIRHPVLKGQEGTEGLDNRAIDMLRNAHLVRAEERGGMTWFELAHDRLVEPIRQDNARWFENNLSLLQRQAERWKEEEYEKRDYLLLHGDSLSEAEAWAESHPDELSRVDRDLLEASHKERERELEEQRQQLALAEEQRARAEEAEAAARRHRRLTRIALVFLAVASVAAILAAILGVASNRNARRAEEGRVEAIALRATAEHSANDAAINAARAEELRSVAEQAQADALATAAELMRADSLRLAGRAEQFLASGNVTGALLTANMAASITRTEASGTAFLSAFRAAGEDLPPDDPAAWPELACELAGRNMTVSEWHLTLPGDPYPLTCPQFGADISYAEEALLACSGVEGVEEARQRYAQTKIPGADNESPDFESWAIPRLLREVAVSEEEKGGNTRVVACLATAQATGFNFDAQAFLLFKEQLAGIPLDLTSDEEARNALQRLQELDSRRSEWPLLVAGVYDEPLAESYLVLCVNLATARDANQACAARNALIQSSPALTHLLPMTRTETAARTPTGVAQSYTFHGAFGDLVTIQMDARDQAPPLTVRDENGTELISQNPTLEQFLALPISGAYTIELAEIGSQPLRTLSLVRTEAETLSLDSSVDAPPTARLWRFEGQEDEVVTIVMEALQKGDPYLLLRDETGVLLAQNDDFAGTLNARIQARLPADGQYFIDAGWYNADASAPYRLSLSTLETLALGEAVEATSDRVEWLFVGNAGDFVSVSMEALGGEASPLVRLVDSGGALISASPTGTGPQAAIRAARLPSDGIYAVNTGWSGDASPYRLVVDSVEPEPLVLGETVTGAAGQALWGFDAPRGASVSVVMEAQDAQGLPFLRLSEASSGLLATDESGDDSLSSLCGVLLGGPGPYVLETGWVGNPGDYTVRVTATEPATLEPGAMVENADEARCLWQFEGQQGQFVALALDAVEPGADPTLSLLDEGGALLVYNDDSPAGLNPRLVALLPADGHYFVKVDWVSGPGPFTLSLTQLQPEALAIGDVITSAGPEQQAWQFTGLAGDRLTIAMDASDPDGDPLLALYDESGGLIGYELGGGAGPNARLHVALPQDGTYLVEADWESQAGAYSLAIEPAETRELSLPETTVEAEPDQWSWQFRGNAGTLVAIAMDALEEGGDPRLRLYDENGDFLAENDDENESSLDALLQFVLPSTGVYYVDAGWTTNPGRYRLTLSQSTQEVDLQDIAQASLQGALSLVEAGYVLDAVDLLRQVELLEASTATSILSADDYNNICWFGSLWDYAQDVLFACDEAVARDPDYIGHVDSRGVARAMLGDFDGAIADFRAFLDGGYLGDEQWRRERQQWIAELETGRNPFDDESLRAYLRENE